MAKKKNAIRADGRLAVQVYIGKDSETGKRRYKTVYGATQKEADEKARAVKTAIGKGLDVSAEQDTFGDWSDRWFELKKAEKLANKWINALASTRKKLTPLRSFPMAKIRQNDVQQIISRLAIKNEKTGRPASRRILNEVKSVASQIFQLAIDNRVIDYNPASNIKISAERPPEKRRAITQQERDWIESYPHRMQLGAMIMLYSGLRRGELLALTWTDIDLKENTITVNKSIDMVNGKPVLKPYTKTLAGMRTVSIPQKLSDFLKYQPKKDFIVFSSAHGGYTSDIEWRNTWTQYLSELNREYGVFKSALGGKPKSKFDPKGTPFVIQKFTAHCLRHTFATMLYQAGIDIMIAKEQLGHSDIKTTLNIYTHLDSAYKKNKIGLLDAYLEGCKSNASQKCE